MNQLFSRLMGLGYFGYVVIVGVVAYEVHLLETNKVYFAGLDLILMIIPTGMGYCSLVVG